MMIVIIIYLFISLILEGFMSNLFVSTFSLISYFTTIYSVIGLVIIYPYFYNKKKYFIVIGILGLCFDLLYTSTFLVNTFIFVLIGIVIRFLSGILSENIFMTNVISIISVILYHVLSFIILVLFGSINYSIMLLGDIIIHSFIMTIIYTSISYLIIKFIYGRFDIKEIK